MYDCTARGCQCRVGFVLLLLRRGCAGPAMLGVIATGLATGLATGRPPWGRPRQRGRGRVAAGRAAGRATERYPQTDTNRIINASQYLRGRFASPRPGRRVRPALPASRAVPTTRGAGGRGFRKRHDGWRPGRSTRQISQQTARRDFGGESTSPLRPARAGRCESRSQPHGSAAAAPPRCGV